MKKLILIIFMPALIFLRLWVKGRLILTANPVRAEDGILVLDWES